jgi:hypothetical protein
MLSFILLLIILILLIIHINTKERFNVQTGVPKSFGEVQSAYPMCLFSNDCYPGYFFRSWRNTRFCA